MFKNFMRDLKINSLVILSLFFLPLSVAAQRPGAAFSGRLYGKVLDEISHEAVSFASVSLLAMQKDSLVAACLVKTNGDFSLENLPAGTFRLRIFFLGYKTFEQNVSVTMQQPEKDQGNLILSRDTKVLNEVAVSGNRDVMQMSIDRKVYNVSKDISTRGGTGLDAVKNIPSVTVDAEGSVSLRNNSVQVYVDGRPTSITLQQIPADQIEQVEVITNPSVKFDAGITGGILNVVMKKNTKPGYNGMVMAGIGSNKRYNTMLNLNVRTGKFNFFGMYNYNTGQNKNDGFTNRTSLSLPAPDSVTGAVNKYYTQTNINTMLNTFQFGRLGFDYQMNNRNSFTLTTNITHGEFGSDDYQTFSYSDTNKAPVSSGNRLNTQNTYFTSYSGQLQYKHTFPKQDKELTSDLTLNTSNAATEYLFDTHLFDKNNTEYSQSPVKQKSNGAASGWNYTWQTDFVNPLKNGAKFETGIRSYYSFSINSQETYNRDSAGTYISFSDLSNNYQIRSLINAAYVNYIGKARGFGYQAGLRFEQTWYKGEISNKNISFEYNYPGSNLKQIMYSLFPAMYISRKLKANQELQFNVSRKINRPNYFQLMPYVMFADNANIRIGNPKLEPEFVNLSEINYSLTYKKYNFFHSLYFRHKENPITTIAYPMNGNPNILVNTFSNGSNSLNFGLDNTIRGNFYRFIDISLNANIFRSEINYTSAGSRFSNKGYSWTGKTMLSMRMPAAFSLQVNGNYQAPQIIPQGKTRPTWYLDITLSKVLKQKFTFTLLFSDVFNSKRMGTDYITPDYTQELSRRRETRYVRLSISYIFGKATFKKPKAKSSNDSIGNQDGLDF
ncbi:MAG: outer membrane beta-barrel family protein [Bacteroidota bacterium]|nr:outer membrane beta-barrel family protein [Bacteroidota bacterium]